MKFFQYICDLSETLICQKNKLQQIKWNISNYIDIGSQEIQSDQIFSIHQIRGFGLQNWPFTREQKQYVFVII